MSELTYLRQHDVVDVFGRLHRVAKVNDCRALVVPIKKRTESFVPATGAHAGKPVTFAVTEEGHGISPNSPLPILGTYIPETGNVKWRGAEPSAAPAPVASPASAPTPQPQPQPVPVPEPKVEHLTQTELL